MATIYYLDTSALVVRYLTRAVGHAWVSSLCAPGSQNVVTLAEITEAEYAAALNQLVRGGTLRRKRCDDAIAVFWRHIDDGDYALIAANSAVIRRAAGLCSIHALRGYDAVQLACVLMLRDSVRASNNASIAAGGIPLGDPVVLTEDARLRDAALAEGFTVDSPKKHP